MLHLGHRKREEMAVMTADNKEFTVTISLDEFHEIFGVLQDKSIKNKEEIELLTGVDVFFSEVPNNGRSRASG